MKHQTLPLLRYFLLAVALPYVLLLGMGKLLAGGPMKSFGELLGPTPYVEYAVSDEVMREMPDLYEPQWLIDRGIPQPPGSTGTFILNLGVVGLTNTWENHALFESWLNEAYGPDHWRYSSESSLDLSFSIGGRIFGLEGVRWWEFEGNDMMHPTYDTATEITYGLDGYDTPIWEWPYLGIYITTQAFSTSLPGAVSLFLLLLLPAIFLYPLRRPLKRALSGLRRNRPTPDQPTT